MGSLTHKLREIFLWIRQREFSMRYVVGLIGIGTLFLVIFFSWLTTPPANFPLDERVEIPSGTTLVESTQILKDREIIRSPLILQIILLSQFTERGVRAGVYQFDEPLSAIAVARAINGGTHGVPLVRVTVPEGLHIHQIDEIVSTAVAGIAPGEFEDAASGKEGYLFPDTYYVPEKYSPEDMVALMEATFLDVLDSLERKIERSGHSKEDLVIMASIIEREARDKDSMELVSGILWKRIDIGMPLQVDASFFYLFGITSAEITRDDLALDSPYNTYKYKGLPPAPISNPGRQALEAALEPVDSPYLYYLTAPNGVFHYARTFEEHLRNKAQYLD